MKNRIIPIIQIFCNISLIPFYFIKLFHERGVFPGVDSEGNSLTHVEDFYYSAYQNLYLGDYQAIFYLSLAMIGLAIIASVLHIIFADKKQVRLLSYCYSICSVLTFVLAMIFASAVDRAY